MPADWSLLTEELSRWSAAGFTPRLWFRDDDAVAPSKPLDRLLELTDRYQVPLVLAVIPEPTGEDLARRLDKVDQIGIAVHGWRHDNHAAAGEKKQELGRHRPTAEIIAELEHGLAKLRDLHGERVLPLLVPPWNRMDTVLMPMLPDIGYEAVSSFADALVAEATARLAVINTHLDLIDWSTRRGCDHADLAMRLVAELRKSRERGGYPLGILGHHLAHDENAWDFLDQVLEMTALVGRCEWLSGAALLQWHREARA